MKGPQVYLSEIMQYVLFVWFQPEWKLADPICTFVFSVIVLVTTLTIMRDILVVLMEGQCHSLCLYLTITFYEFNSFHKTEAAISLLQDILS